MATVIGPTPPGTGVSACATASTLARSISPVSLPVSGSRVMPTSITIAPGLTCRPVIRPRLPVAATRISAVLVMLGRSTGWEGAVVTVAWVLRGRDAGQVDGVRVRDRDGRLVWKEKQCERTPDQAGPPDNDGTLARGIDALPQKQLEHAERRSRNEGWVPLRQAAGIVRMQSVDIFMWWDSLERFIGIEAVGQRHLDEDAVDRWVGGKGLDPFVEVGLRDVVQMLDGGFETDLLRGLVLAADVRRGREIIADLDDGNPGRPLAWMALDREFQLLANGARVGAAVDQAGRHRVGLVSRPGDLDGKGVEIRQWRPLAPPDGDLAHLAIHQEGSRDALRDRLQQVGGFAFDDLPGGLLEQRIADRVLDAVGRGGFAGVDGDLEVSCEDLAQAPLGGLVAVIAEGGQAGQDETAGGPFGNCLTRVRPFCRHVLTNIRVRVMMPR